MLSNNSSDGQDTKKQREALGLELSFEKASDEDAFKDFLKSEDCILILKTCMKYWKENKRIKHSNKNYKRKSD